MNKPENLPMILMQVKTAIKGVYIYIYIKSWKSYNRLTSHFTACKMDNKMHLNHQLNFKLLVYFVRKHNCII